MPAIKTPYTVRCLGYGEPHTFVSRHNRRYGICERCRQNQDRISKGVSARLLESWHSVAESEMQLAELRGE